MAVRAANRTKLEWWASNTTKEAAKERPLKSGKKTKVSADVAEGRRPTPTPRNRSVTERFFFSKL